MNTDNKILKYSFIFLYCFSLWGFLLTKTTFSRPSYLYIVILLLLCLFGMCLLKNTNRESLRLTEVSLWIPYLILTDVSYLLQGSVQFSVYWFVPIVVLLLSSNQNLLISLPNRLLLYTAIISTIGVFTQIVYPPLQQAVSSIYETDNIEKWMNNNIGCAGFTYQLATTAALILIGIPYLLYWNICKKRFFDYLLLILLILGLFLAGKRAFSLFVIIIPLFIYFITAKNGNKILISLVLIILVMIIPLISFDFSVFSSIPGLKRFVDGYTDYQLGEDVTSGRLYIWTYALNLFYQSPIMGIGVGTFADYYEGGIDAHNTYLTVLCEQGIVGFVFYIIPLIKCLTSTIAIIKFKSGTHMESWLKFSLFIQLYYILYSLTGNTNSNLFGYQFYFISIAILVYCKYYYNENLNICS